MIISHHFVYRFTWSVLAVCSIVRWLAEPIQYNRSLPASKDSRILEQSPIRKPGFFWISAQYIFINFFPSWFFIMIQRNQKNRLWIDDERLVKTQDPLSFKCSNLSVYHLGFEWAPSLKPRGWCLYILHIMSASWQKLDWQWTCFLIIIWPLDPQSLYGFGAFDGYSSPTPIVLSFRD